MTPICFPLESQRGEARCCHHSLCPDWRTDNARCVDATPSRRAARGRRRISHKGRSCALTAIRTARARGIDQECEGLLTVDMSLVTFHCRLGRTKLAWTSMTPSTLSSPRVSHAHVDWSLLHCQIHSQHPLRLVTLKSMVYTCRIHSQSLDVFSLRTVSEFAFHAQLWNRVVEARAELRRASG